MSTDYNSIFEHRQATDMVAKWKCHLFPTCCYNSIGSHHHGTTLRMRSLETLLGFYNLQTKHDMQTKLTSIYFSHRGAEGSRSSCIRYANRKYYLLYECTPSIVVYVCYPPHLCYVELYWPTVCTKIKVSTELYFRYTAYFVLMLKKLFSEK